MTDGLSYDMIPHQHSPRTYHYQQTQPHMIPPFFTMNSRVKAAAELDADRIADVHMAAFDTNALLLAQYPTSNVRTQLRDCIASKTAAEIRDPNIAVLVVRDQEDQIISFAKWSLPVSSAGQGTCAETPLRRPEGSNLPVLDEWAAKMEEAHRKVLGETPSYSASFLPIS